MEVEGSQEMEPVNIKTPFLSWRVPEVQAGGKHGHI